MGIFGKRRSSKQLEPAETYTPAPAAAEPPAAAAPVPVLDVDKVKAATNIQKIRRGKASRQSTTMHNLKAHREHSVVDISPDVDANPFVKCLQKCMPAKPS
jgi:hypothetical protein